MTTIPASTSTTTLVPTGPAVIVRHGYEGRRWIALTFDAGSDIGNTAEILDLLAARHVHATFALTGAWARANPELLRLIAVDPMSQGHGIASSLIRPMLAACDTRGTRPGALAQRRHRHSWAKPSLPKKPAHCRRRCARRILSRNPIRKTAGHI